MKWSLKLCRVAGIGVYVHWTFWALILWLVISGVSEDQGTGAILERIGLVLSLFACVVLHEFGHALTARQFGIGTRDITLLPIGGVARLERMPEDPVQELLVALAGPAVNVVIASVLMFCIIYYRGLTLITDWDLSNANFLIQLLLANVMLVLFNLLPAFPMDGGRVLRALLALLMDRTRATQIASTVGQGMAVLFGITGIFVPGFWILLVIALFVFLGAQQEARGVRFKSFMRGMPVRAAMITRFQTLYPSDSLDMALGELLAGDQQDFPVVDEGHVVGLLTRDVLMKAIAAGLRLSEVADVMQTDPLVVDEGSMLDDVFQQIQAGQSTAVPVVRGEALIGLITRDNINEWIMIQTALQRAPAARLVEANPSREA